MALISYGKKQYNPVINFNHDMVNHYILHQLAEINRVKISRDPLDEGIIRYFIPVNQSSNIEGGVFSFSFYIPPPDSREVVEQSSEPYLNGMMQYLNTTTNNEAAFFNWKCVIYTDYYTLGILIQRKESNELYKDFLDHPSILLAVVQWPEFYRREQVRQVKGEILRCMRFRSLFDFNSVIVCIRDADTLWANRRNIGNSYLGINAEALLQWETNAVQAFIEKTQEIEQGILFFGSSKDYKRPFHANEKTGIQPRIGAYAGFLTMIPQVDCLRSITVIRATGEPLQEGIATNQETIEAFPVWEAMVDYLKEHSQKTQFTRTARENSILKSLGRTNTEHGFAEFTNEDKQKEIERVIQSFANRGIKNMPLKIFTQANDKHMNTFSLFSNDWNPNKIGRDEQLILFVLYPSCKQFSFLIELNFFLKTGSSFLDPLKISLPNYIPNVLANQNSGLRLEQLFAGIEPEESSNSSTTTTKQNNMENKLGGKRNTRKRINKKRKTRKASR